jgi:hypothetical protein
MGMWKDAFGAEEPNPAWCCPVVRQREAELLGPRMIGEGASKAWWDLLNVCEDGEYGKEEGHWTVPAPSVPFWRVGGGRGRRIACAWAPMRV